MVEKPRNSVEVARLKRGAMTFLFLSFTFCLTKVSKVSILLVTPKASDIHNEKETGVKVATYSHIRIE